MVSWEIIQNALLIFGGGIGAKLLDSGIEVFRNRKQTQLDLKKLDSESRVALTKLELDSEDKLRLELWERIKSLESRVTELDRKEQECWDKYNILFKSNAELAAELNYVKTILHSSSSEIIKLLPTKSVEAAVMPPHEGIKK